MLKRISLSNWKSHTSSKFKFNTGTNVLVGDMGAGKSSILQAVSFGLFGTFTEIKTRDLKIIETISRGSISKVAEIELIISTAQGPLTINRKIDGNKNVSEGSVRDQNGKLLAGPNPTAVNDFIKSVLKVDEDVFLRTVYGMQNEIDGFLRLSPGERKKRLDELMGLDKFETARKNSQTLRSRIKIELDTTQKLLLDIKSEDIKTQEDELISELDKLSTQKHSLLEKQKEYEKQEVIYKQVLDKIREDAKILNSINEKINNINSQISDINLRLSGIELKDSKETLDIKINDIQRRIDSLIQQKLSASKNLNEKHSSLVDIERTIAVLESKVRGLIKRLGEFQKIEFELEAIKSKYGIKNINNELISLKSQVASKDNVVKMNLAEMESKRRHLEELSSMESLCPLCKTSLGKTGRDKLLSILKKELAGLLYQNDSANKKLDELKKRYDELEEHVEKYKYNIQELSKKEEIRTEKNNLNKELEVNNQILFKLKKDIISFETKVNESDNEINSLSKLKNQMIENQHLYELKDKKILLLKELSDLEYKRQNITVTPEKLRLAEDSFQNIIRKVQEAKTKIEGNTNMFKVKEKRLLEVKEKKTRIEKLTKNVVSLRKKVEFLEKFKNSLQFTQLSLRDELILTVNEVMSSVWLDIYPYHTWTGVKLTVSENDYVLQIKDINDNWVNVSGFASGGERMLASLAMRISFARVMAPELSLLILDEPTHNLDEKAIQTFIEVLQSSISKFINQILIVTHDEKLAESADNIIQLT